MKTVQFTQLPSPSQTYGNVIKSGIPGLSKKPKTKEKKLPEVTYVVKSMPICAEHLKKYNKVCGFKDNGLLPPTYLCVLSQTLQMNMMTQEAFPFPMLGLVHINNTVTQCRPIAQTEVVELACTFGELKPHDKGQQFDFITTALVNGEVVYEALTTYLVRGKSTTEGAKKPSEKLAKPVPTASHIYGSWKIAENIGRKYAPISGDFNLIHIHAVTAKAFGFKTAIAHGMWSKARSLAEIEKQQGSLPESYTVDVAFKLPIFLPASVEIIAEKQAEGVDFTLYDAKSDKPHLTGKIIEG